MADFEIAKFSSAKLKITSSLKVANMREVHYWWDTILCSFIKTQENIKSMFTKVLNPAGFKPLFCPQSSICTRIPKMYNFWPYMLNQNCNDFHCDTFGKLTDGPKYFGDFEQIFDVLVDFARLA